MNADLKEAFSQIKPVCDLVMVCPNAETITSFSQRVEEMKQEALQELQQYILFPFITHVKSEEIDKKYDLQSKMADAMRMVLEKVTVNSFEMCMKIETALLSLVFDNSKPGMVADVPEELKLSVMQCLTTLMLQLDKPSRETLLRTQVPTLAQAVFVAVHIAKLEKHRPLRLAAIDCLTAHTATHAKLTTDKYAISDRALQLVVVDTLANILPGVLAALQDVAVCHHNPGHAVVVAAIEATHRILCLTMQDRLMPRRAELTPQDFARLVREKTGPDREVSKEKKQKFLPKRSPEWYAMAGEKLAVVTRSLVSLSRHEHYRVRKELAVMCYRILSECNATMQPSAPTALDVLISLSKDEYPEVSQYCTTAVRSYLSSNKAEINKTMDGIRDNFVAILSGLARILNNVDASRKLTALDVLHGYVEMLCDDSRPQRLTAALSARDHMQRACDALLEAAALEPVTALQQYATRDVSSPPPKDAPWCKLRHLDSAKLEDRLRTVLRLIGGAECGELVADQLLELFLQQKDSRVVYVVNWMAAAENSPLSLARRVLDTYIAENMWYSPLEVRSSEPPLTTQDTLDATVYNPRAWIKDSVPDLYEGATETRYTGISYRAPRVTPLPDPDSCATLVEAQDNMLLSCLLTEGVGLMATRLKEHYQPYLLKTLCLLLERVGSKYEMLHLAGLKAINDVALACGHQSVGDLIRHNADYFTNQVTVRLKKAWDSQSALQILSVVMEYSDASILDCLYGIVEDVLVQSCDKYYERNLDAYLQVFLTFIQCIQKWFPPDETHKQHSAIDTDIDLLKDVVEFINNKEEAERLLSTEEFEEECGKSVEEMYREDQKRKEEDILDYDDRVTQEKEPLPQHIRVTVTILRRSINFITSRRRHESLLALQVVAAGLPILRGYEDELLPLVHQAWAPLVDRFHIEDPVVLRRALSLLVTMAELAKDFIRSRTVKEVLPSIHKYLQKSALESYLKDAGSAYRNSQAYTLQVAALTALPNLVVDLQLDDKVMEAMASVSLYLSRKQPKPLQALAVTFFKAIQEYDYGATWHYLRRVCDNDTVLEPPIAPMNLEPIVGTPYEPTCDDYVHNIGLIWNNVHTM
ncbi:TELO2-interacting protein 1 homolog isoform X2 [Pectinophora gossypiella]|uniref:TELO2-interacting protein 1 homolog isoform X2 n=1 Tax=Pectinophora gossypiella TaxID=13191 RepID=UPI00214E6370|nr:TELO2-interacting protein 1 homolog isoform X2 [Pectinophora gossypiella]